MNKPGIAHLQRWMNDVITTQGNMQHKLQHAENLYQLNAVDVVADTRNVSIYSRINVYTSGYMMRLLECIYADFPVLKKFMGDEVFDKFAKASLMWSPSRSYSLYDLGGNFINFLEATRPKIEASDEQSLLLELPVEIAKAERALQEALRSKGPEDMLNSEVEIFPGDILFNAHQVFVITPACARFIELKFSVAHLFERLNDDSEYEMPALKKTFLAVSRMHYRPAMEELNEWQYIFLKACGAHATLMEAINETSNRLKLDPATLMAELCIWLPVFRDKGFVVLRPCIE
jgi:hypothetical protein